MRPFRLALTVAATLVLINMPAPAYAKSSEVVDENDASPAYLDIVHAKVTEQKGTATLFFLMELAAAVPNPPIDSFVAYNWQLDTDPTIPGLDFIIVVRWVAHHWETFVLDQRAFNLGTGDLVQTPITDVVFNGATEKVRIDPALIGNPASFRWRVLTRTAPAPAPFIDRAPNTGLVLFIR